jgi:hypothetical protein
MMSKLEWRISKAAFALLTNAIGYVPVAALGEDITLFGMKVKIIDTNEILLVMVV